MEYPTAQVRVMPKQITAAGSGRHNIKCPVNCGRSKCSCGGTVTFVTPTLARLLIDAGAVELLNGPTEQPTIGPSETPTAGPSEFKGPAEKKSSAAAQDGRSTDSALSSELGPAALSSASAEALVSPQRSVLSSRRRKGG